MAKKRGKNRDNARRAKRKVSVLTQEHIEYVDWKDVDLLRRFMSDRAKIRARRVTGNDAQQQRAVAQAIKIAREMALLPYAHRITQHRGGRRGDGGGGGGQGRPRPEAAPASDQEQIGPDVDVEAAAEAVLVEAGAGQESVAEATEVAAEATEAEAAGTAQPAEPSPPEGAGGSPTGAGGEPQ